jgi:signal transduction histidine kinase
MLRRVPGGVRLRTTLAAAVVVAIAFVLGGGALVLALRASLAGAAESAAEDRVNALVATIEASGVDGLPTAAAGPGEDEDDVADLAWQVVATDGDVVVSSGTGGLSLPRSSGDVHLDDDPYVAETRSARPPDGTRFLVTVAASLEDAEESAEALVPVLAVGLPLAVLVVAGTTWVLVGRAFDPVRRIRAQVEQIGGGDLHQRVPVPTVRDEIAGLARTMNAMLDRLEDSAVRQQRFLSDTSHELRSPLASLRQTAEVARSHPAAVDREELVDAVLEETARLQHLVDQMLVLTRTSEGAANRRTEVDLDDLVLAEASRLRRLHPHLTVDTRGVAAGRVLGDAAAFGQVVRNLADNAARHAAGVVRMRVTGANRVELTVEDDGTGIAGDDRERVFDRFVRLDEARTRDAGGSGLGLAIVREVARAHGGDATVGESELGGACFRVSVPAS